LFVSSETADFKCALPYGLTKASINSLVPALSRKVYRRGIRVNGIAPGGTISNMTQNVNENKKTIIIQMPRSAISYQKKLLKWQHSSLVRHLNA
jgi:NAD(P)-dependent dehydrogenase (short-subunit alcohol dehydrogenase family)